MKGVLSQFLFRVFWGLAPEHNFPSSLSLSVASPEEHERTRTTRKYATNAQINTPRVRFARFARLSQVATGSIFRDFKCVFTQKFTRLEGKTKGANLRVEEMHFRKSRRTSTYRFHRARSSLLKSHSVRRFAQVDGVFSRDDVVGTHYVSMRFTSCGFV